MTVSKLYYLIFFTALFTAVRSTFFATGCFGMHCLTTTPAPRPRVQTNTGLRTLLRQNYDDPYDRSVRPLTRNLKKRSLSLVPTARIDVPVVSFPNFRANLIGGEQIGPPQDQYVEFRPTTKEHRDIYSVLYPSGSSKWYSNQKSPKIVRHYAVRQNGAPRLADRKNRKGRIGGKINNARNRFSRLFNKGLEQAIMGRGV